MGWKSALYLAGLASVVAQTTELGSVIFKMSCSQLVLDRIDPLVNPGVVGSPHLHQIVGGSSFNATMSPAEDPAIKSSCTTCTFVDDFSNYWTGVMYFQARNGSYMRVRQLGSLFHDEARGGGITVYYFSPSTRTQNIKIRAFAPGFRMRTGHPDTRALPPHLAGKEAELMSGITYTCLQRNDTRFTHLSYGFPEDPCPQGILATLPFPTCWDGKNLDSLDHSSHVAFPVEGKGYLGAGICPRSHPINIPQVVLEIRWDTRPFNDPALWPVEGSSSRQPFVWSFGDRLGYGNHGDYIFGWRADSLQKMFDRQVCPDDPSCTLQQQSIPAANKCENMPLVKEATNGWLDEMPGGVMADAPGFLL